MTRLVGTKGFGVGPFVPSSSDVHNEVGLEIRFGTGQNWSVLVHLKSSDIEPHQCAYPESNTLHGRTQWSAHEWQ